MGNGDQSGTWGTTTNTNWTLIEQAVAGVQYITMTNANHTLTNLSGASDEARNMVIVASGTISSTYQIIAPMEPKIYIVANNTVGGHDITFGGSGGAIVTIPNGYATVIYGDGTDFFSGSTCSSGDFAVLGNLEVTGNSYVAGNSEVIGDFNVVGDVTVIGSTNIVPIGCIMAYPSSSLPAGFLLCNGQAISRGAYSNLFALIGITFGSGDGSTTFNLPNIPNPITGVYYMIRYN
jgi:hypothetical protein